MIESSGGVFEIVSDGQLLYSKMRTGVFPNEVRLLDMIRKQ